MDSTQQLTYLVLKDTPGKGWIKDQHVTMSIGDARQWVDRGAIELDPSATPGLAKPAIRIASNSDTPESLAEIERETARKRDDVAAKAKRDADDAAAREAVLTPRPVNRNRNFDR